MDCSHTPGPWRVYEGLTHGRVFHQGRTVTAPLAEDPGSSMAVAYCDYHTPEIAEANARLIAAAPDLLAACREIVRLADMGFEESMREPEENGNFAAYEAVKRVIAKAEGAA